MSAEGCARPKRPYRERRSFRWPPAARQLVRSSLEAGGTNGKELIDKLVAETGYPRDACRRFLKQMGIRARRNYGHWSERDLQTLRDLLEEGKSVRAIARLMRRSSNSIYRVLSRLGISTKVGQDWFSIRSLREALSVSNERIKHWIKYKGLKATYRETGTVTWTIIKMDDFARFCEKHCREIVGNRLHLERLQFLYRFAYAPSHAELLPVRSSKKERAAFEEQVRSETLTPLDGIARGEELDESES